MAVVLFIALLAAVGVTVYKLVNRKAHAPFMSAGVAVASVGVFVMVMTAALHAILHN